MSGFFINIPAFIISLIIGIAIIQFTSPDTKEIILYPTDDNVELFQFRDKVNNCFQLNQQPVKCSNDVENIPIQI
jgi:hypothetical protein